MAELKTQKNDDSVDAFIAAIGDDRKREDTEALLGMMERVTGEKPHMWGPSIIGFGDQHYKYESGREGDWFKIGFSPRKQNLTLYVSDYIPADDPLFAKLGKFTTGRACIYIKRLEDVDTGVLEKLVKRSYDNAG
jgi:Domain of unknown function (DU1801)